MDLIVPVYLNQRLVFDLLAMMQGGISTVTAVSRSEGLETNNRESIGTSFGLGQALSSLLKVDLSADAQRSRNESAEHKLSEERVHTPASLLFQLRNILLEKNVLRILSESSSPKAGDFVEFEASLRRNPIVETIDSMSEMLSIAMLFEGNTGHGKGNKNQGKSADNKQMQKQMTEFSDKLKTGDTIDLLASDLTSGHAAVITVESRFLNDPMMSDLVDGNFRVMGKVIRSLESGNESINLIRKSALSRMPEPVLAQALGHLSSLGNTQGFGFPELEWQVSGPAIQVLPIAIFA